MAAAAPGPSTLGCAGPAAGLCTLRLRDTEPRLQKRVCAEQASRPGAGFRQVKGNKAYGGTAEITALQNVVCHVKNALVGKCTLELSQICHTPHLMKPRDSKEVFL